MTRSATRTRITSATTDRSAATQFQPVGTSARSPKARPGLRTSVRARKPSMTWTGARSTSRPSAISLVIWSSTTTGPASSFERCHRTPRGRGSARTAAGEDHRDAALAQPGVRAVLADPLAPRPAALALPAARLVHTDDEAGNFLALVLDSRARPRPAQLDL